MPGKSTDAEKLVNRYWLVGIAGNAEELLVRAAYVVYHDVFETPTIHAISDSGPRVAMATLKDENHKVVFQMPMAALMYVRRADVTVLADRNWTPSELTSAKTELREAAGSAA